MNTKIPFYVHVVQAIALCLFCSGAFGQSQQRKDFKNKVSAGGLISPWAATSSLAQDDNAFYSRHTEILPNGAPAGVGFLAAYERQLTPKISIGIGIELEFFFNDYNNNTTNSANFLSFPVLIKRQWWVLHDLAMIYAGINLTPGVLLFKEQYESYNDRKNYKRAFSMRLPQVVFGGDIQLPLNLSAFVEADFAYLRSDDPDRDFPYRAASLVLSFKTGVSYHF